MRGSRLHGNDGGGSGAANFKFSCIWLHFLSPEPSSSPSPRRRRDLPAGVGDARFPSSRERRGVDRSGKTLNSGAFGCIWLHFLSPEPSSPPSPRGGRNLQGCEVPAFAGTTGLFVETTYANNVATGGAAAQWAVVVFVVGCGAASRMRRTWNLRGSGELHVGLECGASSRLKR